MTTNQSSVVQADVEQVTAVDLADEYARAHREWVESGEEDVWGQTSGDGATSVNTRFIASF